MTLEMVVGIVGAAAAFCTVAWGIAIFFGWRQW
jgi:hypothetical protein